jgi:hypothetical protein
MFRDAETVVTQSFHLFVPICQMRSLSFHSDARASPLLTQRNRRLPRHEVCGQHRQSVLYVRSHAPDHPAVHTAVWIQADGAIRVGISVSGPFLHYNEVSMLISLLCEISFFSV